MVEWIYLKLKFAEKYSNESLFPQILEFRILGILFEFNERSIFMINANIYCKKLFTYFQYNNFSLKAIEFLVFDSVNQMFSSITTDAIIVCMSRNIVFIPNFFSIRVPLGSYGITKEYNFNVIFMSNSLVN